MLNLTAIKTPGVYIDEVPRFPPSIAAVETAIPAFIGYTEKADMLSPGDLHNTPTKIGSIADYQLYFGGPAKPVVAEVQLDLNNQFSSAKVDYQWFLYDSLRLFYANGGGDCYIVSVGLYTAGAPVQGDIQNGIDALVKYDEPTIILFPDAATLTGTALYDLQVSTLSQCDNLKDRVGLFDLKRTDAQGAEFRDKIGINNLKYGMAYTPWIQVALDKNILYADMVGKIKKAGVLIPSLKNFTTDANVQKVIDDLDNLAADSKRISTEFTTLLGTDSLDGLFNKKINKFILSGTATDLQDVFKYLLDIANTVNTLDTTTPAPGTLKNADMIVNLKNTVLALKDRYTNLINYQADLKALATAGYTTQTFAGTATADWGGVLGAAGTANGVLSGPNDKAKMLSVVPLVQNEFYAIQSTIQAGILDAATILEKAKNDALSAGFPLFKSIIAGINNTSMALPPSGSIAGVYAQVDNARGVWKAPANVSILGTPDIIYSNSELNQLNVDVVSGKSINAIRAFTGKGTLVYGARTLAGNDNEWRYVSVRRFFNMVEESTKKATLQFVFEPNDANTWVRVQAMIENFLLTLWRQGALQGATPDKAFYVAVGLGKTMTAQDILNGFMIIEIGMAAVRPAEFIILRFSHILPQA
ncbi:phage tail protein [Chitinophaga varians]|uniref:Phage tail protein n=1 Tax=Chitinophaga varians TaxID=2202339 RepID=A0A847S214_9BACT|nr:phage tail sheath C-terminal domain-containing protein [Chitinophaga varians]NLR67465.1 phage tail protein [Chitinophaga varians]